MDDSKTVTLQDGRVVTLNLLDNEGHYSLIKNHLMQILEELK